MCPKPEKSFRKNQERALATAPAAACRGVTRFAVSLPEAISAWRSSHVFRKFSQSCGVVPKYRASRGAVSALTPR